MTFTVIPGDPKAALSATDPKLKAAMKEIRDLLQKHDVAGFIVISSGEQLEYLNFIADSPNNGPTWSCLTWVPEGIRISAKVKSGGHLERYKANKTVKAVHSIRSAIPNLFGLYHSLCHTFEENFKLEHGETVHAPDKPEL